jgi:enhancing lycopene biosynthesis protein 2
MDVENYDALFIPGGFGNVIVNCNYTTVGEKALLENAIEVFLNDFLREKKVIAAACVAPLLLARIHGTSFGRPGVKVTLGKKGDEKVWPY